MSGRAAKSGFRLRIAPGMIRMWPPIFADLDSLLGDTQKMSGYCRQDAQAHMRKYCMYKEGVCPACGVRPKGSGLGSMENIPSPISSHSLARRRAFPLAARSVLKSSSVTVACEQTIRWKGICILQSRGPSWHGVVGAAQNYA